MRTCFFASFVLLSGALSCRGEPAPERAVAAIAAIPELSAALSPPLSPGERAPRWGELPTSSADRLKLAPAAGIALSVELVAASDRPFVPRGSSLVAADVWKDTSLVWASTPSSIEELRVLHSGAAPHELRWRVRFNPSAQSVRLREGYLEIVDTHGVVQLAASPIFALDAARNRHLPSVSLEVSGGEGVLVARFDPTGVQYPLVVDPLWSTVPAMASARSGHAQKRLADGRVIVVAGHQSGNNAAEIYDPTLNTWSSAGTFDFGALPACDPLGRSSIGATVLSSGRVLAVRRNAGRYDPSTNTWSAGGTPTPADAYSAIVPLSGSKYLAVACGCSAGGGQSASIYDESTNTWTAAPTMPHHEHCSLSRLGPNKALVLGYGAPALFDGVSWSATGASAAFLQNDAQLLPSGKLLVVGSSTAQLFDPSTNTWSAAGAPSVARTDSTLSQLAGGRAIAAGGSFSNTVELYEPSTNSWTPFAPMLSGRRWHAAETLTDGRVLVTGGRYTFGPEGEYALATAEIYGGKLGVACSANLECASGACVDGVCCSASSCALGSKCNTPEKPGACTKVTGVACTASAECASGRCVDGVCCTSACTGQCEACDVTGALGSCVPVVGAPHSLRTACTPTPTECGFRCDGVSRTTCSRPGSSVACGKASCSVGIELHVSTCNGAGACSDTPKSCGAYACGALTCLTTCASDADCASGNFCKSGSCVPRVGLGSACTSTAACSSGLFCTDGACCGVAACAAFETCASGTCKKLPGAPCTADLECSSTHCVDGLCCNTACSGQCEACDVAGKKGTCVAISGDPHGARPACAKGSDVCGTSTCDGAKDPSKCVGWAGDTATACRPAACSATTYQPESRCDGAGSCIAPSKVECAPYVCDEAGCRTGCSKKEHCVSGFVCSDGVCAPIVATCSADLARSTAKDGKVTDCAPYRCGTTGECRSRCAGSADCSSGYVCDVAAAACVQPASTEESGGCAVRRPVEGAGAWLTGLWLLALLRRHSGRASRRKVTLRPAA